MLRSLSSLFFWLLFAAPALRAQEPAPSAPAPAAVPAYDCTTGAYVLSEAFREAYVSGDLDSARVVLQRWGELCGLREVTNRASLLMGLRSNDVFDIDYLAQQLTFLFEYRQRWQLAENGTTYAYDYNRPGYGFLPIGGAYDRFTRTAFDGLGRTGNAQFDFLARAYGTEEAPGIAELGGEEFAGTALQETFLNYRDRALSLPEAHLAGMVGLWIPLGDAALLGNHPEIGFAVGWKKGRLNYDMQILFRFLKSADTYLARRGRDGATEETDKFFGGHLGVTVGYDIWRHRTHEVQVIGGLGGDGFDALNETDDLDAASVISYAGVTGLGYRKYLTPTSYLGLSLKAHFVDYRLNGIVDFNGVPLSLTVAYGSVNNPQRQLILDQLGYPVRQ
ncbi:hypothetical protein [Lewinella sp. IMCC34183]|uniref:hypothetical protein n=1 Tax=Lewinella sp. IMCC34183 TaxID=2248762 RepID=UPI000E224538|nr:hypothetical protein [Lewinella sp. IMCC34183]